MSQEENLAPIALFAYARPDHLRRTVEALLKNAEASRTKIYIFCDAPAQESVRPQTELVRQYVDTIQGFDSVIKVFRENNLGLAKSIIGGVGQVISKHDSVIVVEDDLEVSPFFLRYMNDGLRIYKNDQKVASIHGYTYPVSEVLPETFFIRGADCWGWATWSRAWQVFEEDGRKLLELIKQRGLTEQFDLFGAYSYSTMLQDQVEGRNNSWAIRWHASCYLRNMLTLYPCRSLVNNIGNDDSGTHCATTDVFQLKVLERPVRVDRIDLQEDARAAKAFTRFLARYTSFRGRLIQSIRRRLKRVLRMTHRVNA